jgi:hypothetical protein
MIILRSALVLNILWLCVAKLTPPFYKKPFLHHTQHTLSTHPNRKMSVVATPTVSVVSRADDEFVTMLYTAYGRCLSEVGYQALGENVQDWLTPRDTPSVVGRSCIKVSYKMSRTVNTTSYYPRDCGPNYEDTEEHTISFYVWGRGELNICPKSAIDLDSLYDCGSNSREYTDSDEFVHNDILVKAELIGVSIVSRDVASDILSEKEYVKIARSLVYKFSFNQSYW